MTGGDRPTARDLLARQQQRTLPARGPEACADDATEFLRHLAADGYAVIDTSDAAIERTATRANQVLYGWPNAATGPSRASKKVTEALRAAIAVLTQGDEQQ